MAEITKEDTPEQVAIKIFSRAKVLQSFGIRGWITDSHGKRWEKGALVLNEIRKLYNFSYIDDKGKRIRRLPTGNFIGGSIAHPIFKWERTFPENEVRYTIWRYQ